MIHFQFFDGAVILPTLHPTSEQGVYCENANVIFDSQTRTSLPMLIPYDYVNNTRIPTNIPSLEGYIPFERQVMANPLGITIYSQSDTSTLTFNLMLIKIGFIFAGFSIFLVQPILEGILIEDVKQRRKGP